MKQLALSTITAHAFRQHREACLRYMTAHRDEYATWAILITPDRTDPEVVWGRAVFAVLSARERFANGCAAFVAFTRLGRAVVGNRSLAEVRAIGIAAGLSMPNEKARRIRALGVFLVNNGGPAWLLHTSHEAQQGQGGWRAYRERLMAVPDLARTKASFLACLLYPTEADCACLDTWILRVFANGTTTVNRPQYEAIERRIRQWGKLAGMASTFVAQWAVWDHARGVQETHGVLMGLPGGHKDETPYRPQAGER